MKRLRAIPIPNPSIVLSDSVKQDNKTGSVKFNVLQNHSLNLNEIDPNLMIHLSVDPGNVLAVHLAYTNQYDTTVFDPPSNLDELPIKSLDESQKKQFKKWIHVLASCFQINQVATEAKTMSIQIELKSSTIRPSEILKFKSITHDNLKFYVAESKLYARLDITKNG